MPGGDGRQLLTYRLDLKVDPAGSATSSPVGRAGRANRRLPAGGADQGGHPAARAAAVAPARGSLIGLGGSRSPACPAATWRRERWSPWLARRAPRGWVQARSRRRARRCGRRGAAARDLRCEATQPPCSCEPSDGNARRGAPALALEDPHGLVRASGSSATGGPRRVGRETAAPCSPGTPRGARSRSDDWCRLRLIYGSGRVRTAEEGRLARLSGGIPSAGVARLPGLRGGRGRGWRSSGRADPTPRDIRAAAGPAAPQRDRRGRRQPRPDRARAAMLFAEPGGRDVELVYHVATAPAPAARRGHRRYGEASTAFRTGW